MLDTSVSTRNLEVLGTLTGAVFVDCWRKKLAWREVEGGLGNGNGENSEFRQFFSGIWPRRVKEKWGGNWKVRM